MTSRRRLVCGLVTVMLVAGSACTGDPETARAPSSAPDVRDARKRPLPSPVQVRQEPEGVTLADPAFGSLPGARADHGRVGGSVYQIEMPERWNGRLVLFLHGFEDFESEASVSAPDIRRHLVGRGYAWGASSFSSTSFIPGRAADETAALWDRFATTYGRPERTYLIGLSMGGAASHIAAERYADRFDGALALCGAAGATPGLLVGADLFVAGAYVAGVTQADLDASADTTTLIRDRIRPALRDPQRRDRFERIMVDRTGGPRPFDREGFRLEEDTNWRRAELLVATGLTPSRDTIGRVRPRRAVPGEEDEALDRSAVRLRTNDDLLRAFVAGSDLTGQLQMPLLTLHSTGDGQVPIDQARILRQLVDEAGKDELLVQRVVRDPSHCGFTSTEWLASLEALVEWVERGVRPQGNDVRSDDLRAPRLPFELLPRPGTPEADAVPGAPDRVVLRGTATLDGEPLDARFLGAIVRNGGLVTPCQYTLSSVRGGQFELTVLADTEVTGCGVPGSEILLWTFAHDTQLHSSDALRWPGMGASANVDIRFSTIAPQGAAEPVMELAGEVVGRDGHQLAPGTRIEAFLGEQRCGVTSVRRTGNFSGYVLAVAGPGSVPGCSAGAVLRFLVDGRPTIETAINDDGGGNSSFDLTPA